MEVELKIGEVARLANVRVDTIRYYERLGLITTMGRTSGGYRRFASATVERICFAKELQALGFSLGDVAIILADIDQGGADCAAERPYFERVLARIDARLAALMEVRARLEATLDRCRDGQCDWMERIPPLPR